MGGVSADSEWTTLLAGFLIAGRGIGMTNPSIASIAVGVVPAAEGRDGARESTTPSRQVGIATGIAAFGAIFQHGIESRLAELLPRARRSSSEAVASSGTQAAAACRRAARRAARGRAGRLHRLAQRAPS